MRRVVIDTDIYMDWINQRRHEAIIKAHDRIKHMSAVVLMELYAGARVQKDLELLQDLEDVFRRTGRIVAPEVSDYGECGRLLSRLCRVKGYNRRKAYGLVHDILIVLSARRIGATVITRNRRDFEAIKSVRSFALEVVDA